MMDGFASGLPADQLEIVAVDLRAIDRCCERILAKVGVVERETPDG